MCFIINKLLSFCCSFKQKIMTQLPSLTRNEEVGGTIPESVGLIQFG